MGNWGMQSIVRTVADIKAAYDVLNSDSTDDETADKQFDIALASEAKLCRLLKQMKRKGQKLCDDEQLAVDDLILEPHDPPDFADTFKA
jgi:hypothetical protein